MKFKVWPTWMSYFLLLSLTFINSGTNQKKVLASEGANQEVATQTSFITAEALKAKLSNNEPVTIIDVRSASGLEGDSKIKGAFYVKLRRLKYRLGFHPLKTVPKDRDVVTYCACPSDEASVRAAQILREAGFKRVYVLKGGWVVWRKANGPTEPMVRGA